MPTLSEGFISNYNRLAYGVINYETTIAKNHHLKLLVGAQTSNADNNNFSAFRDQYLSTTVQQLFAGDTRNMSNDGSERNAQVTRTASSDGGPAGRSRARG